MTQSLEGKHILVTGAASGIGAETAATLHSKGALVTTLDRHTPAQSYQNYIHINFLERSSIEMAVQAIRHPVDGVCNIAGVPPTTGAETTLMVNFLGLRHFTNLLTPHLSKNASIVNMASLAGFEWNKSLPAIKAFLKLGIDSDLTDFCKTYKLSGPRSYFFSKEVLRVWTMQQAKKGFRMNTISPGPVDTPILKDFIASLGKRAEDDLKEHRAGTAEEIAPVVSFLCSDESAWIRGANIPTDGGAMAAALAEIYDF